MTTVIMNMDQNEELVLYRSKFTCHKCQARVSVDYLPYMSAMQKEYANSLVRTKKCASCFKETVQ